MGERTEIMPMPMLEHEHAPFAHQPFFDDHLWDLWKLLQGIGWVGKDKIILRTARLQETEHVAPYGHAPTLGLQLGDAAADESVVVAVGLNARHASATARGMFFLLAAVLMFAMRSNFLGLSQIAYVEWVWNKWVVALLAAAVLQLYAGHRLSTELAKEQGRED